MGTFVLDGVSGLPCLAVLGPFPLPAMRAVFLQAGVDLEGSPIARQRLARRSGGVGRMQEESGDHAVTSVLNDGYDA